MLFNSVEFLIFFPTVTLLFFLLPHKVRWTLLLIASCVFYMAFIPVYILILAFTIVIDYFAGILIENRAGSRRKSFLLMSLIANVGVLAAFKYYDFAAHNISELAHLMGVHNSLPALAIILPVGLSFHTFQAMSYTIEVYRGNQKAERNFGIYALYVMFYPQLVAGPIERPQNLIHQFREVHLFDYNRVTDGLKLMLWGMFKKVVIADRLAVYVDEVYKQPRTWGGVPLIIATLFFAFQIYCDFSGYSDIAIGAAQVMGFKLMTNFNRPYHAKSISEFWKRWHISLSTWFRDYLYVPLGGNRASRHRWYFNLFITFLISGIWHGAKWTFVMWGAINGLYLLTSIWTKEARLYFVRLTGLSQHYRVWRPVQILVTFALTCYAWIFFRSNSMSDAIYINKAIAFTLIHPAKLMSSQILGPISLTDLMWGVAVISLLEVFHLLQRGRSIRAMLMERPVWFRWAVYYSLVFGILVFGEFGRRQFIYFQF